MLVKPSGSVVVARQRALATTGRVTVTGERGIVSDERPTNVRDGWPPALSMAKMPDPVGMLPAHRSTISSTLNGKARS